MKEVPKGMGGAKREPLPAVRKKLFSCVEHIGASGSVPTAVTWDHAEPVLI
jgi:hypothetical protein